MSWRPKAQVLAPIKELGDRCCLYSPSCREGFFSEIRRAGGHTKGAESLAAPPPAFNRRVYRPLGLSSRPALSLPSLLLGSSSSPMIASLALSISPLSSSSCSLSGCLALSRPGGVASSVLGGTSPVLDGPTSSSIPPVLGGGAPSQGASGRPPVRGESAGSCCVP